MICPASISGSCLQETEGGPRCRPTECDRTVESVGLLRRVLSEYLAGNRIVNGHWYAPDEGGEPHYLNDPATADELALIESLRTEIGL